MTVKSYLLLSGGGLLATYLVTAQPGVSPAQRPAPSRATSAPAGTRIDIREQAERLQTRVRPDVEYQEPSRNPFRFQARPAPRRQPASEPAVVAPPPAAEEPPPPPIRLSGVSADQGRRTAYLVTVQGVLAVVEGDTVPPDYRVGRIDDDAIELVAGDGTTRRLMLRP